MIFNFLNNQRQWINDKLISITQSFYKQLLFWCLIYVNVAEGKHHVLIKIILSNNIKSY